MWVSRTIAAPTGVAKVMRASAEGLDEKVDRQRHGSQPDEHCRKLAKITKPQPRVARNRISGRRCSRYPGAIAMPTSQVVPNATTAWAVELHSQVPICSGNKTNASGAARQ